MLTELYLLRHGETEWNKNSIIQGQTDTELNESGLKAARKAVDLFKEIELDYIYSSDLKRARKTAQFIAQDKNLAIRESSKIREIAFGDWEGLKYNQIKDNFPRRAAAWEEDPLHNSPNSGENLLDFKKRVDNFFQKILSKHQGGKILVVSHGGVIKTYLTSVLAIEVNKYWQFQIDNCSLTELKFYAQDPILSKLNFTNYKK